MEALRQCFAASESDRAAAVVAGSLLEEMVRHAISAFMVYDDNVQKELFQASRALGSFENKIHLGYLLGIYSRRFYKELLIIKKIRNDFAHKVECDSFEHQDINNRCKSLKIIDECYLLDDGIRDLSDMTYMRTYLTKNEYEERVLKPRNRFLNSIQVYTNHLAQFAGNPRRPTGPYIE